MDSFSLLFFRTFLFLLALTIGTNDVLTAQHSIAKEWNEVNLQAVRRNGARPTVISRNLYHHSILMYDLWATYDGVARPVFLGDSLGEYYCEFDGVPTPTDVDAALHEAISYASYRLLRHRYDSNPGQSENIAMIDQFMMGLGYDASVISTDYADGTPAHLGNYIAAQMITAGYQDGAFENVGYQIQYYSEVNPYLDMTDRGYDNVVNMDRWQRMYMNIIWDQQCAEFFSGTRPFIGPEWGNVVPFALADSVKSTYVDDRGTWNVYHDPGPPDLFNEESGEHNEYNWGFELVGVWSSMLDPTDTVMWDISPASIGNIPLDSLPSNSSEYPDFYNFFEGGDASLGHDLNPVTGQPYAPQVVKRSDYARILAEFWADGPDSEAPPGHWYTIYNEVSDYPEFSWKWHGVGDSLDHLEYDVKAYLTLGGALHDAAVTAWGLKGYYDYIRPVAALRALTDMYGQRTDPSNVANYHPDGIDLIPGYIEIIEAGDPLITDTTQYLLNEIKIKSWLGPGDEIPCESTGGPGTPPVFPTEVSGVGWRPIKEWWPYQRPTFVTPPFAGYVSGHSTFSRAAAEVMTAITGDSYFPGGMGVFECPAENFLIFEEGPTQDIELQWATYQDASDQCSLSRIWGGIHPPCDDIPGRKIGYRIGVDAFIKAQTYFDPVAPEVVSAFASDDLITDTDDGDQLTFTVIYNEQMDIDKLPTLTTSGPAMGLTEPSLVWVNDSTLTASYDVSDANEMIGDLTLTVDGATDLAGNVQSTPALTFLYLDTENPIAVLNDFQAIDMPILSYGFTFEFSEAMDLNSIPQFETPVEDALASSLMLSEAEWIDSVTYHFEYDLLDANEELDLIDVRLSSALDSVGNIMMTLDSADAFSIDTREPLAISITPTVVMINESVVTEGVFSIDVTFDEEMDQTSTPELSLLDDPSVDGTLTLSSSMWTDAFTHHYDYAVTDIDVQDVMVDATLIGGADLAANELITVEMPGTFSIDTRAPLISAVSFSDPVVDDEIAIANEFYIDFTFDEAMDQSQTSPLIGFIGVDPSPLTPSSASGWMDITTYRSFYTIVDTDIEVYDVEVTMAALLDQASNTHGEESSITSFSIDTRNPLVELITANIYDIDNGDQGEGTFAILLGFDEAMDTGTGPAIDFPVEDPLAQSLVLNAGMSSWLSPQMYEMRYDVLDVTEMLTDIDVAARLGTDTVGNVQVPFTSADLFNIDLDEALSIADLGGLPIARVYPNPAFGGERITIDLTEIVGEVMLDVLDVSGRRVQQAMYPSAGASISLELDELSEGMYLVILESEGRRSLVKLQVNR